MAGLCVSVAFDGRRTTANDVELMIAAAPYRGIDGSRTWDGRGATLGHQERLLLPEDAVDQQPLVADGLVVVADARIDNRDELVPLLSRHGCLVDVGALPDCEVILAAYRLWGRGCAARLIGDFAFVVWDDQRRSLFAARDPMGMRSLYYRWEARRRLLLATEIKQLTAAADVPREIYEPAVAATLAGPYLPPTWTHFAGIEQVPPGHALEVDADASRTFRSWEPDPSVRFGSTDERVAADVFRDTLQEAVRARMRSTRPVGIFLSGGLDSGSVASMAGWLAEQAELPAEARPRTYSWAYDTLPGKDERSVSDHINRRYSLPATAVPADDSWPLARYPEHAPDEDDPYCWVYQALVDRALDRCRDDGVGTLLNGDRGDEVTGDWVFDELAMLRAGRVREAFTDVGAISEITGLGTAAALRRHVLRPVVQAHAPALLERLSGRRSNGAAWPTWVSDEFARRVDLADIIAEHKRRPTFDGAARTVRYQRAFSPQSARIAVLRERRRAQRGMSFADPFSDRRLVELVLSMPQWLVQRRTQPKALARAAAAGVMPEEARLAARKKIPYSLYDRGFRERAVPVVDHLLTGSHAAARGWLDDTQLRSTYERYVVTGDADSDFWWPLTVEMWLRRWWS